MRDRISALMDGELDDKSAGELIRAMRAGGEPAEAWRAYHLIGDALRDTRPLSPGFEARVAARLAAEPTVIGGRMPVRQRRWLPVAAAASAAVALVGWVAFAPQSPQGPVAPPVAQAPATKPAPAQVVPMPTAANDYLLAHQGFSPRVFLQGMAPYVRTVSTEGSAR